MAITSGDWIALAAVGLAAIGFVGRRKLRLWRSDGVSQKAGVQSAVDRLISSYEKLETRTNQHERECASRWGEYAGTMQSVTDNLARLSRSTENLSAQMSRMVPGDVFVEATPRRTQP